MWHGFYFLLFLLLGGRLLEGSKEESELRKNLFKNYSVVVLPVESPNSPIVVTFRVIFYRIIDLDEKNQVLDTSVEVVERWTDAYLKWDPTDYGGIEEIIVPYASIWTPDIVLLNRLKSSRRHAWKGPFTPMSKEPMSERDLPLSEVPSPTEGQEKQETDMEIGISQSNLQMEMENWKIASCILDRFFLYLFAFLNFAVTFGIFLSHLN